MGIKDLSDQANLYDNYQIMFGLQMSLSSIIDDYNKRIGDALKAIQANVGYANLLPEEQAYLTSISQAAQSASSAVKVPVNPNSVVSPVVTP